MVSGTLVAAPVCSGGVGLIPSPRGPLPLPRPGAVGDSAGEVAPDGEATPSGVAPARPLPLPLSDGAPVAAGEAVGLSAPVDAPVGLG